MGILSRRTKQRAAEMEKSYFPLTWRNKPSVQSPVNATNLNHIESGINELDNRIVILSQDKAERSDLAGVFNGFEFDPKTGVMTFIRFDGSRVEKDTAMEKISLNCRLDGNDFVLELADGSSQRVSLSKFIDTYTFKSTEMIRMDVSGKTVSAYIQDGSVTLEKLEESVMSSIRKCVLDAQTAEGTAKREATLSESWATGNTGAREGENTDNSRYYSEQSSLQADRAKDEADRAESYSKITAPGFYFDPETSCLYMKGGQKLDFLLEGATLYWKVV